MVPVVILLVILATVAHILIALLAPGEANAHDELTEGVVKLVLYRRDA
jgi:hypothetical protein